MTGVSVTTRLTEREAKLLNAAALSEGRTRSNMVRAMLCRQLGIPVPEPMRVWPRGWFRDDLTAGDRIYVGGREHEVIDAGPTRVRAVAVMKEAG